MSRSRTRTGLMLGLVAAMAACQSGPHVSLRAKGDAVLIEIDGEAFAAHHPGGGERTKPYLFPVFGPGNALMTRAYPLTEPLAGEEKDHPHHTGLWFAHGDVNGVDFWHGPGGRHPNGGRIVQQRVVEMESGSIGRLVTENLYENEAGDPICSEQRTLEFFASEAGRFLDYTVTIRADRGPVTMGDTKEGVMAIRVPATLRPEGEVARGQAVTSAGLENGAAWGKRAAWADYWGPVDGETMGVALFDHPQNPVHPSRGVIRDYGLFAANPFGLHHFEKKPRGTGAVKIAAGSAMTFRYRFFFHRGTPTEAGVAAEYARFAAPDARR